MLEERKICKCCGKELVRKRIGKRNIWESSKVFQKRVFCDINCMKKYKVEPKITNSTWSAAHEKARNVNKYYKGVDYCEICGKKDCKLDVHHIDKNENNNNVSNLQVLCRGCHIKIHNPKSICKVQGCDSYVKGYGYCNKHYMRYKKYGSPYVVRWNTRHTKNEVAILGQMIPGKEHFYKEVNSEFI